MGPRQATFHANPAHEMAVAHGTMQQPHLPVRTGSAASPLSMNMHSNLRPHRPFPPSCGCVILLIVFRGEDDLVDKREKSISYRRAQWLVDDPASINLASCINQAAVKLTTVAERTVPRGNGRFVRLAMLKPDSKGGLYLHLTEDTPGELGSGLIKSTIQEQRRGRQRPSNFAPACRSGLRCA